MSIRRYTVKRIDVDYYTVSEEELVIGSRVYVDRLGFPVRVEDVIKWDWICSSGGQWAEQDIPQQAQQAWKRSPRTPLRKDGQSYTFYACVYWFPEPRLMGKWKDYTSAGGFNG